MKNKHLLSLVTAASLLMIAATGYSQNVGIGQKAPLSKLDVKGNLTVGVDYSGMTAPTNGAIIEGNVGIGTTSSSELLTIGTSSPVTVDNLGNVTISSLSAGSIIATGAGGLLQIITAPELANTYLQWNGSAYTWASASASLANLTPGTGLSGSAYNGSTAQTWGVNYGNSAGTAVQGNTSLTITAGTALTGGGTVTLGSSGNTVTLNVGTVGVVNGGTGNTTLTTDGILYGKGTAALGITTAGVTGQILTNSSGTPLWTTTTYPATTTINQLLYSSGTNAVTGLATANNGVLTTSSTGVPSWLTPGTDGYVLTLSSSGAPTWASAAASLANHTAGTGLSGSAYNGSTAQTWSVNYGSAAGTAVQGNTTLTVTAGTGMSGGGAITLGSGGTVTLNNTGILSIGVSSPLSSTGGTTPTISLGTVGVANGGTGLTTFGGTNTLLYTTTANNLSLITTADNGVLITNSAGAPSWLAPGTDGYVLTLSSSGVPTWAAESVSLANHTAGTGLSGSAYNGSAAQTWSVNYGSTAGTAVQGNTTLTVTAGTGMSGGGAITLGSGGTVTLNNTGILSIGVSSPLSSTGGTTPTISLGTVDVANGGTGDNTLASKGILYGNGTGAVSVTAAGSQGQILTVNSSGTPAWTTATYPATTTTNQILYSSGTNTVTGLATANDGILTTSSAGVPSWLAAGTSGQVLTMSSSGVPSWSTSTSSGSSNYWTLSGSKLYPTSTSYNVGVGTNSPATQLDVNGDLALRDTAISGASGSSYTLNPNGFSFVRLTGTSSFTLTTISGGVNGKILIIYDVNANMKVASGGNIIGWDSYGTSSVINAGTFIYDSPDSKWILIAAQ